MLLYNIQNANIVLINDYSVNNLPALPLKSTLGEVKELESEFIRKRITELRIKKGVSEYKISVDLGHSRSYMQSIVSGRSLPSMAEFLYICKYLGVTPSDFFNEEIADPALVKKAFAGIAKLSEKDLALLLSLIERFSEK